MAGIYVCVSTHFPSLLHIIQFELIGKQTIDWDYMPNFPLLYIAYKENIPLFYIYISFLCNVKEEALCKISRHKEKKHCIYSDDTC